MIYLQIFWNFFKIGLFTFGGGYAMIPLIVEMAETTGWIPIETVYDFIAISETTPGPIAINMATFVGTTVGGAEGSAFLGALVATLGVVLPSFIIILLIAALFTGFLKNKTVNKALNGVKPVVVGLIIGTAVNMAYKTLSLKPFDFISLGIMIAVAIACLVYKKIRKKALSPIIVILGAAVLGMSFYSL